TIKSVVLATRSKILLLKTILLIENSCRLQIGNRHSMPSFVTRRSKSPPLLMNTASRELNVVQR
ncbi:MAG: hypothetical protein ABJB61_10605, partial [bacterium]